jgi:lysozyme family protein
LIGNFKACLAFDERKDIEGGNGNDAEDPGGRTSRGITQREYDAWQHLHNGAFGDVWTAPQATIDAIYEHSYWNPYGDILPQGVDLMYFDVAVNEGAGKAVLFLQRALKIPDDGHFGVVTASGVKQISALSGGVHALIASVADERRTDYHRMRRLFRRFGAGWLARVAKCETAALEMADGVDGAAKVVA